MSSHFAFSQENGAIQYSKCSRYAVDWHSVFNFTDLNFNDFQSNSSWPTEYCFNGWVYNKTFVKSSIVIDVGYNRSNNNNYFVH